METFPTLTRKGSRKGYSEKRSKNAVNIASKASGLPLVNKLFTFDPTTWKYTLDLVSDVDKATLLTFYNANKDVPFYWPNPQDGLVYEVIFDGPPAVTIAGSDGTNVYWKIVLTLVQYSPATVANSCLLARVAHWKLDDNGANTTVLDWSGNAYTGVLKGGDNTADLSITGKVGKAFRFNGTDDSVNCGDILKNGTNSFSVSAWFKTTSVATGTSNAILQNKSTGTAVAAGYRLAAPAGTIVFHIADGVNQASMSRGSGLNDDSWHHVVGVVDRTTDLMRLYIDGLLSGDASSTAAIGDITSVNDLCIGSLSDQWHFFDGGIDDAMIFNRALTANEVAWLALGEES